MPVPVAIGRSFLSSSATVLYEVPTSKVLVLKQILLCNQDGSGQGVSLYSVPAGGDAEDANSFLRLAEIDPGATEPIEMNMMLEAGDQLVGVANNPDVVSIAADGVLLDADESPAALVLARGMVPDSATLAYESVAVTTVMKHIAVCNTTADPHTFSLYSVAAEQTQGDGHALFKAYTVPGRSTLFASLVHTMDEGSALYVEADVAGALTLIASGVAA